MESVKADERERSSVINGSWYMPGTTQEFLDGIRNYRLIGNEIFVASFPKCGQLWVTEIIWQILHDGMIDETPMTQRNIFIDIIPSLEKITASELFQRIESLPGPKVIRTHYLPSSLPKMLFQVSNDPIAKCDADLTSKEITRDSYTVSKDVHFSFNHEVEQVTKGKVIYIVRNPWDAAVSRFHHLRQFSISNQVAPNTTWDEFFELFIQEKCTKNEISTLLGIFEAFIWQTYEIVR